MIDVWRDLGADRDHGCSAGDDWRTLLRFSSAVWFSVGIGILALLPARHALEPGAAGRLLWSAAFAFTAGVITRLFTRRTLLLGDMALRAIGIWVLYQNVEHTVAPAQRLLLLPVFLTSIVIPALFYRAIPLTLVAAAVTLTTGQLALASDAPIGVRTVAWASVVWVMALIIVVIQRLVTERRRALDAMTALAATDALTGLPNRRHFMTSAHHMLTIADDENRPCTLILLDVDHFKSVNDVYGHDMGDQVLTGVASAMRSATRSDDLVARLGGEEFAILMLGASVLHAQHLAAELASRLREIEPVGVTASYGVVEAKPGDMEISELLVRADVALYQAKRSGRNRCVVEP
jgi:diguanylate cyclase (GGDEF)-like protein